jgi:hypothetical protein
VDEYPSYHLGDEALAQLHATHMGPHGYTTTMRYWCVHRAIDPDKLDARYLQQIEYGRCAPRTLAEEVCVDGKWRRVGPSGQQVRT